MSNATTSTIKAAFTPTPGKIATGLILAFVCALGWSYETAYFSRLGISTPEATHWGHYAISGGRLIVTLVLGLLVYTVSRYLTRGHLRSFRDDFDPDILAKDIATMEKGVAFNLMRVGAGMSFAILVIAIVGLPWGGEISGVPLLVAFISFGAHYPILIKEEANMRVMVLVSLIASWMMCAAASGIGVADLQMRTNGVIRDDTFTVVKDDIQIVARARELNFPAINVAKKFLPNWE